MNGSCEFMCVLVSMASWSCILLNHNYQFKGLHSRGLKIWIIVIETDIKMENLSICLQKNRHLKNWSEYEMEIIGKRYIYIKTL